MKKIFIITLLLAPFYTLAQKLQKPSINKVTGDTLQATSKDKLYMHGNYLTQTGEAVVCWVQKSSARSMPVLVLNIQTLNTRPVFSIAKDQNATILLSDNSKIKLGSAIDDFGNAAVDLIGDNVVTTGSAYGYYVLTGADIAELRSSSVTAVSIETTAGSFSYDIKPKNGDLIKKQLDLVLKQK